MNPDEPVCAVLCPRKKEESSTDAQFKAFAAFPIFFEVVSA
jgi:hypothetical protein